MLQKPRPEVNRDLQLSTIRDTNTQERAADAKPPCLRYENVKKSWRHSLESELLDGKDIKVFRQVEHLDDQDVEVNIGRRAAGAWQEAWRAGALFTLKRP